MNFKILIICSLLNKINLCLASESPKISHDIHEVQIVFATTDYRGNFISNLNMPIKRFFKNKSTAYYFVKRLNFAHNNSLKSTYNMLQLIKLTDIERTSLENTTVKDWRSRHFFRAGSMLLADDIAIYVKQIKPA